MAAKNAIVPQVSLSVKVGMVVMRLWLMQAALKQEADQPCCVVSESETADFRTASGRTRSGNKIAHPINIFAARCGLDTTCHIYSKRPSLVDRFCYIFRI
jgi:hypothetical protein